MPSNLERKARRKRQTRLTFDPVGQSSSPASTRYPAKVRYQLDGKARTPTSSHQDLAAGFESDDVLSSSKKDEVRPMSQKKNGKLPFKPLPTPVKSSQPVLQVDETSDTIEVGQDTMPSSNARQTRSVAKFMSSTGSKRNQRSRGFDGAYSSEDSDVENVTPSKKESSASKKKNTIVSLISDSEDSEESAPHATPIRSSTRKGTSGSGASRVTRSSQSISKNQKQKSINLSDSDSDDDELVPLSQITSGRKVKAEARSPALPTLRPSTERALRENSDSSDDDPIISSPKRSQKPIYQAIQDDEDEEEEEDIKPSPLKRRLRQVFEEEEEDDNEPTISPLKRARRAVESETSDMDVSPTKRRRRGTQQDVESDSDKSSAPKRNTRGQSRTSESDTAQRTTRQHKKKHRTEKEKNFELLRRKRNGDTRELTPSASESEEEEFEQLSEFDDEEEEEEVAVRKPSKGKQKDDAGDIDSDNFVTDDDEDGDIGIPGLASIPLEFTHQAHKSLKEHFKDAIEWMVHNKINPAFPRDDAIYQQAFRKLNDECSGLAKSKFASTQWTREFTRAVYARPILEEHPLNPGEGYDMASGLPKCFACNHKKHQPSVALVFDGKAYNKITLEELDQRSSSDSDDSESSRDSDDSESSSVDSKGEKLPPVSKRYPSGPVCKENAQQTHTLVHWKYNLNQWVISSLEQEGELTPEKLVERDALNLKKRTKYTNAVVDRWESSGIIKQLWHDFKTVTNEAREKKAKGRGGWQ